MENRKINNDAVPLVVDMDGTLIRSDTLYEAALLYLSQSPLNLFKLIAWLLQGKNVFKRKLADNCIADAEQLPVNEDVIDLVKSAKDEGREVVLVSASDERQVDAVAQEIDLFDFSRGSDFSDQDGENLKGDAKAAYLCERYGEGQFDYVGDSRADLPIWKVSRKAYTVGGSSRLKDEVEKSVSVFEHLSSSQERVGRAKLCIRAMRPHQWVKNVLIFVPMLVSQDLAAFWSAILAFFAFSMTASAVYLINDLLDIPADRAHPRKRNRPFASGALSATVGIGLAAVLLCGSFVFSAVFLPAEFLAALSFYLLLTFAYSFVLKRKLIVDVWTLAVLYTTRLLAGAAATATILSPWILGFSMFLFFSLAAVKRQAELIDQAKRGETKSGGRAYMTSDLPILQMMGLASGYAAVLLFALYTNNVAVTEQYKSPAVLWGICPILLYWISRIAIMTHREHMTDDPIVFSATDWQSRICAILMIICFIAASMIAW